MPKGILGLSQPSKHITLTSRCSVSLWDHAKLASKMVLTCKFGVTHFSRISLLPKVHCHMNGPCINSRLSILSATLDLRLWIAAGVTYPVCPSWLAPREVPQALHAMCPAVLWGWSLLYPLRCFETIVT